MQSAAKYQYIIRSSHKYEESPYTHLYSITLSNNSDMCVKSVCCAHLFVLGYFQLVQNLVINLRTQTVWPELWFLAVFKDTKKDTIKRSPFLYFIQYFDNTDKRKQKHIILAKAAVCRSQPHLPKASLI